MKSKLSLAQRLELIRAYQNGEKASDLCRRFRISRVLFYRLLKRYNFSTNPKTALLPKKPQVGRFARQLQPRVELSILRSVACNPTKSVSQLHIVLSPTLKVSRHAIQNVLLRNNLNKKELRLQFAKDHQGIIRQNPSGLSPRDRGIMFDMVKRGKTVSEVCRKFGISRVIFYRLKKRYEEAGGAFFALEDKERKVERFGRQAPREVEEKIKQIVVASPLLSSHKISAFMKTQSDVPALGNHGVHNVLKRLDLNTINKRILFAQGSTAPAPKVKVAPLYAPQMPMYRLRQLIAPFVTIPKLLITKPLSGILAILATFIPLTLIFLWLRSIINAPLGPSTLGLIFASVALFFGLFFFLYSLKYYLTILMVLRLAQSGAAAQGTEGTEGREGREGQRINPLLINLEKVELSDRPFVSIHVAIYNETKVIERLIKACTNQEWFVQKSIESIKSTTGTKGSDLAPDTFDTPGAPDTLANYELVIVDDSTDETTELARQLLIAEGWQLTKGITGITSTTGTTGFEQNTELLTEAHGTFDTLGTRDTPDRQVFIFTRPDSPTVKLIHRASREGFKGGALQKALENTDSRAKYILVFDADFVPYPDTVEQFVKTFQVLGTGTSGQGLGARDSANLDSKPYTLDTNNIAAVQGYQWHVLNKSQTWVTRGVRTEYAGSYVIERSGAEIYQGLKQIAGSVYCIRADVLRNFGWGTSITEDFELTLRLYEAGYKVAFTPYIQAPAEAVSTIKRLIRQRMRWAEGASFNVKIMLSRMLFGNWETTPSVIASETKQSNNEIATSFDELRIRNDRDERAWVPSRLTLAEKLEFIYLAPYYLQAAFLVIGTMSWFLSEAVFHTRLPFWTAAFGWSLVFTNLLSLPLMNVIGLFLEESDERDYVGILSFIALSYIVVPFQAYAAIKGFLESREGPWFRTPKTGAITDVFERSRFAKLFGNIFGRPVAAVHANPAMNLGHDMRIGAIPDLRFLLSSKLYLESDISSPKPKRLPLLSKSILAALLICAIVLNYSALFTRQTYAQAPDPAIEQQINIIDQNFPTTSTTDTPTDNSLGLVNFDSANYSGDTVYFEAVIVCGSCSGGNAQASATLYTSGGSAITTVSTTASSWTRVRSASVSLSAGNYTVRLKLDATSGTARIVAARLIIAQSDATNITNTQTQIEVGNNETITTDTTVVVLTDKKLWLYTSGSYDGTVTTTFGATVWRGNGNYTASACLYTTGGTEVGCVGANNNSPTYPTPVSVSLTNGTTYEVRVKTDSDQSKTAEIANAKVIISQTAAGGLTKMELYHQYANTLRASGSVLGIITEYHNLYTPGNFVGGTFGYFHEATLKNSAVNGFARLINFDADPDDEIDNPTSSEVSNNTSSYVRSRSADLSGNSDWPSSATQLDTIIYTSDISGATSVSTSWLIIVVTNLQIPENVWFFIPLVIFIPATIKFFRRKKLALVDNK